MNIEIIPRNSLLEIHYRICKIELLPRFHYNVIYLLKKNSLFDFYHHHQTIFLMPIVRFIKS